MDAVRALLGVERVAPAGERELARRVGAGVGPRDARRRWRRRSRSRRGAGRVPLRRRSPAAPAAAPRSAGPAPRSSASCGARRSPSRCRRTAAPGGAGVVDEQVELAAVLASTTSRIRPGASGSVRSAAITRRAAELVGERAAACPRAARRASAAPPGSRARRRAVASPIPLDAPVMSATKAIERAGYRVTLRTVRVSVAHREPEHARAADRPVVHGRDRLRHQLDRRADAVLPGPLQGLRARWIHSLARLLPYKLQQIPGIMSEGSAGRGSSRRARRRWAAWRSTAGSPSSARRASSSSR